MLPLTPTLRTAPHTLCAAVILMLAGLTATWAPPLPAIRSRIAAGDFYSAESLLQQHRIAHGEDGAYLQGLGWLARGAFLTGLPSEASRYATEARNAAMAIIGRQGFQGADDAVSALGAALDVEAQFWREGSSHQAVEMLQRHLKTYDKAPLALGSLLTLRQRVDRVSQVGTVVAGCASVHIRFDRTGLDGRRRAVGSLEPLHPLSTRKDGLAHQGPHQVLSEAIIFGSTRPPATQWDRLVTTNSHQLQ